MKRLQAYKFEIEPNGEQLRAMRMFAGNARKVWNLALARQEANHAVGEKFTSAFGMNNWLPAWKEEFPFLRESPAQTLQQVMENLAQGYKRFFKKTADHPVFKKKGKSADGFRFPEPKHFTVDQANSRIKLPKLGWISYRNSREILGTPKNITLSAHGGKWFASIQTEREVDQPLPTAKTMVGIDVGINRFATLSDASYIEPTNAFKQHEDRLAKAQRRMSHIKRCSNKQFSNNWKKARARVQQIHCRIANVRKDFLHKTSTAISKNQAMVCVEDLKVSNMSRSAKGSIEQPGKQVRQKAGLNRAILDQGWGEFRRQLSYKMDWNGGYLVAVPAQHTSQTCPCCGWVAKENRLTQAKFACVVCGYENHADVVGAINILNRGIMQYEGQDIAGKNFYRPTSDKAKAQYAKQFAPLKLFTIDEAFGGWAKADAAHFADGASFDQIYTQK